MSRTLCVLNARPQPRGASLTAMLLAAGIKVVEYSPIMITPLLGLKDSEHSKSIAYNLDHFTDIVITSGFAAEIGLDFLSNYWPQWPETRWWSIGSATQQFMSDFAIDALMSSTDDGHSKAQNSESLLEAMIQKSAQRPNQNILIIAGQDGRGYLQSKLEQEGISFSILEVYQRTLNTETPPLQRFNAIILTSVDIAKGILSSHQALAEFGPECHFICASERIADFVRSKGASKVINSRSANNETVSNHIKQLLL